MAESSWPSPSNGRVVDDTQYEKLGITTGPSGGVYGDFTSPQLIYGDSTGLQVKVAADRYALVRGHVWWSGSSIVTKSISSNSSGSTRVDLVVLQLSRTTWDATIVIVAGTPGAGAPSPTQNVGTTGVFQLVLAQVSVGNGAGTITAGNVTYVASHIGAGGQLRVPSATGLTYVPLPHAGMQAIMDSTADIYLRNAANSAWVITSQQGPTAFTPTFNTSNSNGVVGSGGSVTSEYTIFNGKYVNFRGVLLFGSTMSGGTGNFVISLPIQASSFGGTSINSVGSFVARDTSASGYYAGSCYAGVSATLMTFVAGGNGLLTATNPFTWANTDYLCWNITYPIA